MQQPIRGLKARSIISFKTVSKLPHSMAPCGRKPFAQIIGNLTPFMHKDLLNRQR
jgi:hypothetical protein